MSHAHGQVRFADGEILYFEYDGTSDVVMPQLRRSVEEVNEHWRKNQDWSKCKCPSAPEPVEIFSDYGYGFWWTGTACRKCMRIASALQPESIREDTVMHKGIPAWVKW